MLSMNKKSFSSSKTIAYALPIRREGLRSNLLWLLAASLAMLLFGSCSQPTPQELTEESLLTVSTYHAQSERYNPVLQLTGTVFAQQEANLGAGFPGKVERILYPEGTQVKKDQLLVEMAGEMLSQAETEYLTLKRDYERVSRLVKNGTISQQEYDHVKARFEASTAKYELARKNTQIRAPFAGTIVDYMVNEGENYFLNFNLEPGYSNTSGILRLMQLDPVKVVLEVNEKDLNKLRRGLPVEVTADAFAGEVFQGQISLIKPYLSTRTRTASVEISIPNPGHRLKPGMFARTSIQLPEEQAVFIPMEALYRDPETDTEKVFVVHQDLVEAREVVRLSSRKDMLVVSGIEAGDEVIMGGKNRVAQGDRVVIVNNGGK